jgi:hypothetical protein
MITVFNILYLMRESAAVLYEMRPWACMGLQSINGPFPQLPLLGNSFLHEMTTTWNHGSN